MKRICSVLLAAAICLLLAAPAFGAEGQSVQVNQLNGWIVMDGVRVYPQLDEANSRSPITYNGTAYIPVLAAGQWLGADVSYSEESKTVTITHNDDGPIYYTLDDLRKKNVVWDDWDGLDGNQSQRQSAGLRNDVTITVDGQVTEFADANGEPVYPLQFQGHILLPLEVIVQLSGKQVVETPYDFINIIHLFDTPAQAEYAEAEAWLADVRGHVDAVRAMVKGESPKTEEEFTEKLREAQTHLKAVWTLPAPAFKGMAPYVNDLRDAAELVLWENIDPYLPAEENSGASPLGSEPKRMIAWGPVTDDDGSTAYVPDPDKVPDFDPDKFWTAFAEKTILSAEGKEGYTTYFLDLEKACTDSENFLTKVIPAAPVAAQFTDAAQIGHWEAVATLVELGIIEGKDDGAFHPADTLTRAEAAKLLCLASGTKEEPHFSEPIVHFSDCVGHWAEAYITLCAEVGVVSGKGDGTFDPDAEVTCMAFTKMCLTTLGYGAERYGLIGEAWAEKTDQLARSCSPSLYTDLVGVRSNVPITRDDAAQMIYNILQNKGITLETGTGTGRSEWQYKVSDTSLFELCNWGEWPEIPDQPE